MKSERKIKVFLVDNHPVVREGVRSCLRRYEQLEVVGEAANGHEAIDRAKEFAPDIILMDVTMPGMNGLEASKVPCVRSVPKRGCLFLPCTKGEFVREMIQSGARGYIRKNTSPMELVSAIEKLPSRRNLFYARCGPGFLRRLCAQRRANGRDQRACLIVKKKCSL